MPRKKPAAPVRSRRSFSEEFRREAVQMLLDRARQYELATAILPTDRLQKLRYHSPQQFCVGCGAAAVNLRRTRDS
jgi:hypothetical protein